MPSDPPSLLFGAPKQSMRLARYIARTGYCSRREAEKHILAGRVHVEGTLVDHPAFLVDGGQAVSIDGKPLQTPQKTALWRFHKPLRVLTAKKDDAGRQLLPDILPAFARTFHPVGRLDFMTEGLLLLTNDGELKQFLELPKNGFARRYRLLLRGRPPDLATLRALRKGIRVKDWQYGPVVMRCSKAKNGTFRAEITLREGKNREVRHIAAALDLEVRRLVRIGFGPYRLDGLPVGALARAPLTSLGIGGS